VRFFAPGDAGETTRRVHAAPPVLDQHGGAVRAWLGTAGTGAGDGSGTTTQQKEPLR
jgi:hypothetical protein